MQLRINSVRDVAECHLCCGCGACAYVSPERVEMVDALDVGRRPIVRGNGPTEEAIAACPGVQLEHTFSRSQPGLILSLADAWGPVLEVWEGYAFDAQIRFAGSSGGVATALAAFCMERQGMHGTLHIAARKDVPYLNETVLSRTREQLLANTGSRYAPASPCDGLKKIEDAPAPCVFIGKPCDVAGANKAAALRPKLAEKLGLTIGIFCAGTPSTRGTLEMIKAMGVADLSAVTSVRYRGNGWPGRATAVLKGANGTEESRQLSYEESWGAILTRHVQWRCRICPDHTGEFADIAVGDPWNKPPAQDEPGRSLIVARTPAGSRVLANAITAGYIRAERVRPDSLERAQPNLLRARANVWGRLLGCRVARIAVPRFRRLPMGRHWLLRLTLNEKLKSLVGTFRRVYRLGLRKRLPVQPFRPFGTTSDVQTDGGEANGRLQI